MSFQPKGSHGYQALLKSVPDFAVGDFTTDGTWKVNGLDLSGLVPKGTYAVHFKLSISDNLVGSQFGIRHSASYAENRIFGYTFVANISSEYDFTLPLDTDLALDYYGANLVFSSLDVTILGYLFRSVV